MCSKDMEGCSACINTEMLPFLWNRLALLLVLVVFLNLFIKEIYVPHPYMPSWSDMTDSSTDRKSAAWLGRPVVIIPNLNAS